MGHIDSALYKIAYLPYIFHCGMKTDGPDPATLPEVNCNSHSTTRPLQPHTNHTYSSSSSAGGAETEVKGHHTKGRVFVLGTLLEDVHNSNLEGWPVPTG